jgi:hypothetical protein
MNARAVQTYLDGHFKNVQGWCLPQLWQVINPLANELHAKGIRNPIAEIGVYHGKFFYWPCDNHGRPTQLCH